MSYYPTNFYSNYPYGQQSYMMNPYSQPQQQQQMGLQGKMVDGEEMVKATDVPVGGYGIFPKADLSEIYIKTWNNNGTTNIITFQPIANKQKEEQEKNLILEKLQLLENKIDNLVVPAATQVEKTAASVATKRKEFNI